MTTTPRRPPNLTPVQQRRLDRWHQQWGRAIRQTTELRDAAEQLIRAGDQPAAAGYPTNTNSGPGPKGGHGDPTLAHIEHAAGGRSDPNRPWEDTRDSWPAQPDVVHDQLAELVALSARIQRDLQRAARIKDMIVNRKDPRVMERGGACKACGRMVAGGDEDRLRSLYCKACYEAWLRWREGKSDPSHHAFQEWRRERLTDEEEKRSA